MLLARAVELLDGFEQPKNVREYVPQLAKLTPTSAAVAQYIYTYLHMYELRTKFRLGATYRGL